MEPFFAEEFEQVVVCRAFQHQVGGHKCVLQITDNLICKPCEEAERLFYNSTPEELKPYVPGYRGEIFVYCEGDENKHTIYAKVPRSILRNQRLNAGKDRCIGDGSWSQSRLNHCIEGGALWKDNTNEKFLMFDNLVADFERPCALDIKLCRYYHGQCEDEHKRKKLEQKSNNSTSLSLGFRICGMQVYHPETGKLEKHNKYFGMSINDNQAVDVLRTFFGNSSNTNLHNISNTVRNIHTAILNQTDFVFLSISLFFFYDCKKPDVTPSIQNAEVDDQNVQAGFKVRLIDFEKAIASSDIKINQLPQRIKDNINYGMVNLANIIDSFVIEK